MKEYTPITDIMQLNAEYATRAFSIGFKSWQLMIESQWKMMQAFAPKERKSAEVVDLAQWRKTKEWFRGK